MVLSSSQLSKQPKFILAYIIRPIEVTWLPFSLNWISNIAHTPFLARKGMLNNVCIIRSFFCSNEHREQVWRFTVSIVQPEREGFVCLGQRPCYSLSSVFYIELQTSSLVLIIQQMCCYWNYNPYDDTNDLTLIVSVLSWRFINSWV